MRIKKVIAGITALAVIGSTGCFSVFAENSENIGYSNDTDNVNYVEDSGSADNAENADESDHTAAAESYENAAADYTEDISAENVSTDDYTENTAEYDGIADGTEINAAETAENILPYEENTYDTEKSIEINETNFPDANFRNYVLKYIDKGNDGILWESELAAVTEIMFKGSSSWAMYNLKGIEYFTNLTKLSVNYYVTNLDLSNNTALTYLDLQSCSSLTNIDLSNNTALTYLDLRYCSSLTNIDLSNNTALETFDCSGSAIISLDVSNNTALKKLNCYNTVLTSLDLSNNTELKELYIGNSKILSIDLSNNTALTYLDCNNTPISGLDISHNTALVTLYCKEDKRLTSLDISNNTALKNLYCNDSNLLTLNAKNKSLERLECTGTKLTALDLSDDTNLRYADVSGNNLKSLDVSNDMLLKTLYCQNNNLTSINVNNSGLTYLDCRNNKLPTIDLSGAVALQEAYCNDNQLATINAGSPSLKILKCYNNKLTDLDLSNALSLEKVYCYNNKLTNITVKNFNLVYLECNDNCIESIDLSDCVSLKELYCYNNKLKSIDLSDCLAMKKLSCGNNALASLDIENTAMEEVYCYDNGLVTFEGGNVETLTYLSCGNNKIESLNISGNIKLSGLYVNNSSLKNIDLSNNTALYRLECGDNMLTELDLSNNQKLDTLYCQGNMLTELDLKNNINLDELYCCNNMLTSLDLSNTKVTRFYPERLPTNNQWNPNKYPLGDVHGAFALSALKGFDPSKASDWSGAEYDPDTNSLVNFANEDGGTISYKYDCGKNKTATFTLVYDSYTAEKIESIAVDETNFPDAAFRQYVSENFDNDGDGALSPYEFEEVTAIYVYGKGISDLKGIEYFTALTILVCSNNKLTSLDVSNNTALTTLHCYSNQLTSLDVSNNTALTELYCNENQLTSLDVSNNTALTKLYCYYNKLTSLDVSGATALTGLWCYNNHLTSLDVSKNRALKYLECYNNTFKIGNVKDSYSLSDLKGFDPAKASNWDGAEYDSAANSLKNFASKDGGAVTYTYDCGNNYTETFTLVYDRGDKTKDIAVNETNFPDATFRAYVSDNFDTDGDGALSPGEIAVVKGIDVSGIYGNYGNVSSLKGIEYFTSLTYLCCDCNQLTSLDVSKNTALELFACAGNQLTSLDVSKNTALRNLNCENNQITSLDVSNNTALEGLECSYNQLTSLDVSKNTNLTGLSCYGNQLTSLDVSKNTALKYLHCYDNQLTSLDVSKNMALETLYCGSNQLTSLDISNNTALTSFNCSYNTFNIGNVKGSYSLSNLKGFDPAKASNWNGAEYDSATKSLKNFASKDGGEVTYTYNCGNNKSAVFTLVYDSYAADAPVIPEKLTVTAAAGDGSVTLNWNDLGAGVTYKVYSYNKSNNKYSAVAEVTGTTYTVTGLTNGKEYGYLVRAKINGTWSSYTVNDVVYATPKGSTADKLAVTAAAGDRSVTLNWNSLGTGVKYKVYGYNGTKYSTIASDVTETSYIVKNLTNGTKYGFLVRAYVNGAWTAYTVNDVVYAAPKGSTVDKLAVTATAGDKSVTLNWNDMGTGVTYKVYSYNKSNNKYASVAEVTGTTYTVTGLTNGKEYGYLVRAKVNGTWSSYTVNDVVYATPKGSTADKLVVTAAAGDRSVTLSWNSLGTGVKYKVYGYNGTKYSAIASDVTDTSYTVKDLKNGTKYGFLVRAYVNGAWTAYTVNDVVYATPKGSTVDKLVVTATAGDGSVTLNWNSLGNGVKYKVYGYNGTKYSTIASDVTDTSYTVTGLKNGTKYGFLVRAYVNGAWTSYTVNDVVYAEPKA